MRDLQTLASSASAVLVYLVQHHNSSNYQAQHRTHDFMVSTCIDSCHAAAGSCDITANTLYDVYLVAQDFVTPTPNLQTSPTQGLLNTSDTSGDFSCTAGIFTSMLKPDIVPLGATPGLPTSQLYGNWSATRCAMQNNLCLEVADNACQIF